MTFRGHLYRLKLRFSNFHRSRVSLHFLFGWKFPFGIKSLKFKGLSSYEFFHINAFKMHVLGRNRVVWAIKRFSIFRFIVCARQRIQKKHENVICHLCVEHHRTVNRNYFCHVPRFHRLVSSQNLCRLMKPFLVYRGSNFRVSHRNDAWPF